MAKDVIHVDGEDVVVREDVAKKRRGVVWALLSIGIIVAIIAALFIAGAFRTATDDGSGKSPSKIEETERK
ncbi:MAG: hypothetical protein KIS76_13245 [Pyrinomonadaceae bacterium]|nr:hypothetical protein [Pyrinomonadaceae bacterium]